MCRPSLKEAKAITGKYKTIPLMKEIPSNMKTPIEVLRILKRVSKHCYMLESRESNQTWGRYTFLGFDPRLEISCTNGVIKIVSGATIQVETGDPGKYIRQILEEYRGPQLPYLPSFSGGLVGYFSFDYIKYSEPSLKLDAEDKENFKDFDLMLFDKVIAFDHLEQKIIFIVNMKTESLETEYHRAEVELQNLCHLVCTGQECEAEPGTLQSEFRPLFDKDAFCSMVHRAKEYIKEGDIFQVVLSNRLEADFKGSLLNAYEVLRISNPSPYMFYFSSDDLEIAGASPETLVKLKGETLYTYPLAGTRPRGKTEKEDLELEQELLNDPKELAEHNMLVDLGRNDLGKISKFGTVEVEQYKVIERFSHVMHLGSTVRGQIRADKNALDAIHAVLPAGTLSGAPKIRACEIINELENKKRGIYGGAIGYFDFTGNMDTCIAIRLAYQKNGKVIVRSGAGIVADSIPEKEYEECINKAQAVIRALRGSSEGSL